MQRIPLINLHLNSTYSFYHSLIPLPELVKQAIASGADTLVLTDRNLSGLGEFFKLCLEHNLRPIVGLEVEVEKEAVILIAKNNQGLSQLIKITSLSTPISFSDLIALDSEDNLLIIDHPRLGFKSRAVKLEQLEELKNFYYHCEDLGDRRGVYVVENRLLNQEDNEVLSLLHFNLTSQKETFQLEKVRFFVETEPNSALAKLILKTNKLLEGISLSLEPVPFNIPWEGDELTAEEALRKLCLEMLQLKVSELATSKQEFFIVKDRVIRELGVIERARMSSYFLLIYDLIKAAKKKDVMVGPGRGSVAGCFIAYLLGITAVNPLKFDLFFERFLNEAREDLPDIDIDFEDTRRDEVIHYLQKRYGSERVARITTLQKTGPKNAIRDAANYIGLDIVDLEGLLRFVSNEARLEQQLSSNHFLRNRVYSSTINEHVFKLATKIEELPRNISTHASGVVVSSQELSGQVPLFKLNDGLRQTQFTMEWLNKVGLIKIDILGLKTLTFLREICAYVRKFYQQNPDFERIKLDESAVFDILKRGLNFKLFQLDSPGMKRALLEVRPEHLEDLVNLLALYRPGPIREIKNYVSGKFLGQRREGPEEIDRILERTYGVLIYQEQVMQICHEYGGLSPSQADLLRRAISKKDYQVINQLGKIIRQNLRDRGVSFARINSVISLITRFAAYGFNKAHAVAYGIITYRSAYLKTFFPLAFYSWILDNYQLESDELTRLRNETAYFKIQILPPLLNYPQTKVNRLLNRLILPLSYIKGLSIKSIKLIEKRIETSGEFQSLAEVLGFWYEHKLAKAELESLIRAEALRGLVKTMNLITNFDYVWYLGDIYMKNSRFSEPLIKDVVNQELKDDWDLLGQGQITTLGDVFLAPNNSLNQSKAITDKQQGTKEKVTILIKAIQGAFSKRGQTYLIVDAFNGWFGERLLIFNNIESFREKLKPWHFYEVLTTRLKDVRMVTNLIKEVFFE